MTDQPGKEDGGAGEKKAARRKKGREFPRRQRVKGPKKKEKHFSSWWSCPRNRGDSASGAVVDLVQGGSRVKLTVTEKQSGMFPRVVHLKLVIQDLHRRMLGPGQTEKFESQKKKMCEAASQARRGALPLLDGDERPGPGDARVTRDSHIEI